MALPGTRKPLISGNLAAAFSPLLCLPPSLALASLQALSQLPSPLPCSASSQLHPTACPRALSPPRSLPPRLRSPQCTQGLRPPVHISIFQVLPQDMLLSSSSPALVICQVSAIGGAQTLGQEPERSTSLGGSCWGRPELPTGNRVVHFNLDFFSPSVFQTDCQGLLNNGHAAHRPQSTERVHLLFQIFQSLFRHNGRKRQLRNARGSTNGGPASPPRKKIARSS